MGKGRQNYKCSKGSAMSKEVQQQILCDLCGRKCSKGHKTFRTIERWLSHDCGIQINIKVSTFIPYGPQNPDICESCAIKGVKKLLKETNV